MKNNVFKLLFALCLILLAIHVILLINIKTKLTDAKSEAIIYKNNINLLQDSIHECYTRIDSIVLYKDSINILNEKLFLTNYKIERIKEYNVIAAKGNNIKYLRGWINRVIK